jgi:hypothetical protein
MEATAMTAVETATTTSLTLGKAANEAMTTPTVAPVMISQMSLPPLDPQRPSSGLAVARHAHRLSA